MVLELGGNLPSILHYSTIQAQTAGWYRVMEGRDVGCAVFIGMWPGGGLLHHHVPRGQPWLASPRCLGRSWQARVAARFSGLEDG